MGSQSEPRLLSHLSHISQRSVGAEVRDRLIEPKALVICLESSKDSEPDRGGRAKAPASEGQARAAAARIVLMLQRQCRAVPTSSSARRQDTETTGHWLKGPVDCERERRRECWCLAAGDILHLSHSPFPRGVVSCQDQARRLGDTFSRPGLTNDKLLAPFSSTASEPEYAYTNAA
jgi:hypothetical protein